MIKFLFSKVRSWFSKLFERPSGYRASFVEDLPKCLDVDRVYVAGVPANAWVAAMLCPCGCGDTLHMNLLKSQRPCWTVSVGEGGAVSFHPSLWRKTNCKSHFFLKKGRVQWVRR